MFTCALYAIGIQIELDWQKAIKDDFLRYGGPKITISLFQAATAESSADVLVQMPAFIAIVCLVIYPLKSIKDDVSASKIFCFFYIFNHRFSLKK